jgi:hypothetical protein
MFGHQRGRGTPVFGQHLVATGQHQRHPPAQPVEVALDEGIRVAAQHGHHDLLPGGAQGGCELPGNVPEIVLLHRRALLGRRRRRPHAHSRCLGQDRADRQGQRKKEEMTLQGRWQHVRVHTIKVSIRSIMNSVSS